MAFTLPAIQARLILIPAKALAPPMLMPALMICAIDKHSKSAALRQRCSVMRCERGMANVSAILLPLVRQRARISVTRERQARRQRVATFVTMTARYARYAPDARADARAAG